MSNHKNTVFCSLNTRLVLVLESAGVSIYRQVQFKINLRQTMQKPIVFGGVAGGEGQVHNTVPPSLKPCMAP